MLNSNKPTQWRCIPFRGPLRIAFLGTGGATLPLFLHRYIQPTPQVDCVEIDPIVLRAATEAMGVPRDLAGLRLIQVWPRVDRSPFQRTRPSRFAPEQADAADYMAGMAARGELLDVVVFDVFDGENQVRTPLPLHKGRGRVRAPCLGCMGGPVAVLRE